MKKKLVIILCILLVFLCYGFYVFRNSMYWDIMMARKSLNASRPENAVNLPELSDAISDIRVTVVPRDCNFSSEVFESWGAAQGKRHFFQIYYGYCVDGVWTDLPCENYPLISVFNGRDYYTNELRVYTNFDAVTRDHMVKVGPFLLISLDKKYQVSDSVGSKVNLLFKEYDGSYDECNAMYGYLREEYNSVVSGRVDFKAADGFDARNYVIVDYTAITPNYELWASYTVEEDEYKLVLTYDDIVYLLAEYGQ